MLRKKLIPFLLIFIFSLLTSISKADQLTLLTKSQADQTVKFFKENNVSQMILWCACCNGESMTKVNVTKYFARFSGTDNLYEIVIEGRYDDGRFYSNTIDLAYVFVRSGNDAKCLGKLLKFKCDPCTLPFDWDSYKRQVNNHTDSLKKRTIRRTNR